VKNNKAFLILLKDILHQCKGSPEKLLLRQ